MQRIDDRLIFAATDLSDYLACTHLSLLNHRRAHGGPSPPFRDDDPALDVLRHRGHLHEQQYLAARREEGSIRVVEVGDHAESTGFQRLERRTGETLAAMRSGADLIYQGALFDGRWMGYPDFLQRVPRPSTLGDWSYEVIDAKLAREAKGGALLQVLLYADLLREVQGVMPEHVHLALGGPEPRTFDFRVTDYAAYFRSIRSRFLESLRNAPVDVPHAPEPVAHCDLCDWIQVCGRERREADHLSLVAGITRHQRRALGERGIVTLEGLATAQVPFEPRVDGISAHSLEWIHAQAGIQLEGRRTGRHLHELLQPITEGRGLAALPPPSPGDFFFDLEGDSFALTHGIEYLFGFADAAGEYTADWALDRTAERRAFESFIDRVMARLREHPGLHIYHYAPYEPTALKRLMGRYASREDEVDALLRGGVLVDLYHVVRHALRASVESYSIKKLEPLYGFVRSTDLWSASRALASFEAWLELGGGADDRDRLTAEIQGYNRDDCVSTLRLRDWLETLRSGLEQETGTPVPRPSPESMEPSEEVRRRSEEVDAVMRDLTAGLPDDPAHQSPGQRAKWLLAQLLEFHRREKKSMWWEYFRRLGMSAEELIEDRGTLGGLEYVGEVGVVKRSVIHRYAFPVQECDLRDGDRAVDPTTQNSAGEIVDVDERARTIDLRRGQNSTAPHPRALIPDKNVQDKELSESLLRLARATLEYGFADSHPCRSAVDILLRTAPRLVPGAPERLILDGESTLDAAIRLVAQLDASVLPLQGPPGAGKTFTAARMILAAVRAGRRVGITATSHKVISNLLEETCRAAVRIGFELKAVQKGEPEQVSKAAQVTRAKSNDEVLEALQQGEAHVAAGTAWLWSRDEMIGAVDVLFIDEAGQFALANALAVAPAARNLVLLGDPQQLQQPQQGVHPPGADASVLEHILDGAPTLRDPQGLFLDRTWRLHPDLCAFTSESFYESRLDSRDELRRQVVRGPSKWSGAGLRLVPVVHQGNENESPEEVEAVARIIDEILAAPSTWIDAKGEEKQVTLNDVLVVAPYNAQVADLAAGLPAGARVGTVDRFQGQEAPIVIYSMTSSSAEDAPRGMTFLYNLNRLNVATSRARCLAIVVASPRLFVPDCRTPDQMRLANAFCRFRELATEVTHPS